MSGWQVYVLVVALVATAMAQQAMGFFPEHAKQGELWKLVQAQTFALSEVSHDLSNDSAPSPQDSPSPAAKWFTQRLDHFADEEENGKATFQQRFYQEDKFWKQPYGPVVLFIGGEGNLDKAPQGFVHVLAKHFGAKIFALEHRFYGQSVPNQDLSTKNLKHLSVEQALADLKYFRDTYDPSLQHNKWIAIGGSYPGALSAWFRIAYPDTTVASLASSGVVNPILKFHAFDEHVAQAIGFHCANAIRAVTAAFESQISQGNGTAAKGLLGAEKLEDPDFFYMLADAAAMVVQYGHKNQLCEFAHNASSHLEDEVYLTERFAAFTNKYYGDQFGSGCFYDTNCLANEPAKWPNVRSWRWQKCSQLAYFQVAPAEGSLRSKMVDYDYHIRQCKRAFGDQVDPVAGVAKIKEKFGADRPLGHRVFYSNGGDDPWLRASLTHNIGADEIANVAQCDLCGHCGDLGDTTKTTPQLLVDQRDEILAYFAKWLGTAVVEGEDDSVLLNTADAYVRTSTNPVENSGNAAIDAYRSSPLVLVPVALVFVALIVIVRVDVLRDSRPIDARRFPRNEAGYCRLEYMNEAMLY